MYNRSKNKIKYCTVCKEIFALVLFLPLSFHCQWTNFRLGNFSSLYIFRIERQLTNQFQQILVGSSLKVLKLARAKITHHGKK